MASNTYFQRVEQGWFTQSDQEKPRSPPDFLSKVYSVPKAVIRDVESRFKEGATPNEIMRTLGNTRRVALSALYAEVLKQTNSTRIEALVKATEIRSVKRLDIVKMIVELQQVGYIPPLIDNSLTSSELGGKSRGI